MCFVRRAVATVAASATAMAMAVCASSLLPHNWVVSEGGGSGLPSRRLVKLRLGASRVSCRGVRAMAPDEEKMTRRSPLDFPIEWDRPRPGRRADIFPQFSPMKTPLPPPLPADPPEEDEDEDEEKKEEEEEDSPEEPEKPEVQP